MCKIIRIQKGESSQTYTLLLCELSEYHDFFPFQKVTFNFMYHLAC